MDLRQLRYFVTVAEELHFGRAAERLHIVPSSVSEQIRRLERDLGAVLFDRTTRTVRLTADGERLLPHARTILADVETARAALAAPSGPLRLGTTTGLGDRLDALLEALGPRPVELVPLPSEERLRRLRAGDLDAALIRGAHDFTGLTAHPVWSDDLVAAVPATLAPPAPALAATATGGPEPGGPEPGGEPPLDLAVLAGVPLRLAPAAANPRLRELILRTCAEAGFTPTPGPDFTTDQDTLAAIGHGPASWSVFYAVKAARLSARGVVFRELRPSPRMPTALVVRAGDDREGVSALLAAARAAGAPRPATAPGAPADPPG